MSYQLTEGKKIRLKENIIQGAKNYEKFLNKKCFKVICENGDCTEIRFFKNDFKHLTGIDSDLNKPDFFSKCFDETISTGNIKTEQTYDWSTLKGKSDRISKIHELLYHDAEKTILLNKLKTHTLTFPVAIRNDELNICVGFVGDINRARSLRKATTSKDSQKEENVIAIFGKKDDSDIFDEVVYIKDEDKLINTYSEAMQDVSFTAISNFGIETDYLQ